MNVLVQMKSSYWKARQKDGAPQELGKEKESNLRQAEPSSSLMVTPASLHLSTHSSRAWSSADRWHSMQLLGTLVNSLSVHVGSWESAYCCYCGTC